jgi:hypothetical protein
VKALRIKAAHQDKSMDALVKGLVDDYLATLKASGK